jgi:hypothetical protein
MTACTIYLVVWTRSRTNRICGTGKENVQPMAGSDP